MSREFNFDELDKAVNSLIGDPASQSPSAQPSANSARTLPSPAPTTQPTVPPVTPSPSVPVNPAPPRTNNTPLPSRNIPAVERAVPAPAPQTAAPPTPPPAAPTIASAPPPSAPTVEKSGAPGRFMDVMHPTSDMATPTGEEVKKGAGAEGKTIEPLNNNIAPEPLPEKSAANTPNSAQLSIKAPVNPDAMVTTPDTEEKAWKDPLEEVAKNKKDHQIKQGAQERLGLTPKADSKEEGISEGKKPLFLPDAKVEKRPLGTFAGEDNNEEKPPKKEDSPTKLTIDGDKDTELGEKKTEEEPDELLLPELGKEIVAVEAGGSIVDGEGLEKKDEDKSETKEQEKKKKDDKKIPAKPETFSIPKQYKEKQASADHKPKSIYDTEEYHRSLATAAAKKKKGSKWWVWVLIILGLLILGVSMGAGAYFLVGI